MRNVERYKQAYLLRQKGLTLKQIGERFGVSTERARQLVSFVRLRGLPRA